MELQNAFCDLREPKLTVVARQIERNGIRAFYQFANEANPRLRTQTNVIDEYTINAFRAWVGNRLRMTHYVCEQYASAVIATVRYVAEMQSHRSD